MDMQESLSHLCLSNIDPISNTITTSFNDLLEELVMDIFSRLPIKNLGQSTCVSKKWYFIIKSHSFISTHLSRSISDPSRYYNIFLTRQHSPSVAIVSDYNHVLTLTHHLNLNILPFEVGLGTTREIIGNCNGLVCVNDCVDIYLINPFIQKCKKIGAESSCYSELTKPIAGDFFNIRVFFGYSEIENDFKIVRILYRFVDGSRPCDFYPKVTTKVEFYSLKTGKWKVTLDAFSDRVPYHGSGIIVNHCLYWLTDPWLKYSDISLLCFNMKDQVFSNIEMPPTFLQLSCKHRFHALTKNGSVALYAIGSGDSENPQSKGKIFIFVLEKGSDGHEIRWKKMYYESPQSLPDYSIIGFSSGGRLIFARRYLFEPVTVNNIFALDLLVAVESGNSFPMEKLELDINDSFKDAIIVEESLVLLSD